MRTLLLATATICAAGVLLPRAATGYKQESFTATFTNAVNRGTQCEWPLCLRLLQRRRRQKSMCVFQVVLVRKQLGGGKGVRRPQSGVLAASAPHLSTSFLPGSDAAEHRPSCCGGSLAMATSCACQL